jgi:hypothetical protein
MVDMKAFFSAVIAAIVAAAIAAWALDRVDLSSASVYQSEPQRPGLTGGCWNARASRRVIRGA